jgi:hypothetical protein
MTPFDRKSAHNPNAFFVRPVPLIPALSELPACPKTLLWRRTHHLSRILATCKRLFMFAETVVEKSFIPIKWGHYAETQEVPREAEGLAAIRNSEGMERNLGVFGTARVGSQTMGGRRNAPKSRGPIRLHFFR